MNIYSELYKIDIMSDMGVHIYIIIYRKIVGVAVAKV